MWWWIHSPRLSHDLHLPGVIKQIKCQSNLFSWLWDRLTENYWEPGNNLMCHVSSVFRGGRGWTWSSSNRNFCQNEKSKSLRIIEIFQPRIKDVVDCLHTTHKALSLIPRTTIDRQTDNRNTLTGGHSNISKRNTLTRGHNNIIRVPSSYSCCLWSFGVSPGSRPAGWQS